jgi:hypothetical protein
MVHALTEVRRTLIPDGALVDIRPFMPFRPLELVRKDQAQVLGRLDEVPFDPTDAAADEALAEVFRRRLFSLEETTSFFYAGYWDSVGELKDYLRDWYDVAKLPRALSGEARRALRCAGPGARLRLQMVIVVNRLRKVG